ncbi:PEP-CTERM sorting domain-containing protein [Pontiellaceae bacterium B12227]|nr:PEP-CTERM sorting domain-containing protein [Pontiellaceae bacterium B12227]
MKTKAIAILTALSAVAIQVPAEVILVDFGNDSSYRGASVDAGGAGIDENGNHWNSVWSGAYYSNMTDKDGNTTAIDFGFSSAGGSDYFNGPSGSTADPTATVYDGVALGNLGADEAVYDYYAGNNTFTIQGLDPTKTYNLTFYGSHKYDTPGTSTYTVFTSNDYSTVVGSVGLAHNNESINGFEWQHNENRVVTISGLSPQYANSLWVESDGYINAMQIEVIPEPATLGLVTALGFGVLFVRRMFML